MDIVSNEDTVDDMIARLFQYSDKYDRNNPAEVQRARDMLDAAALLRYYVDEDRRKLEDIKKRGFSLT